MPLIKIIYLISNTYKEGNQTRLSFGVPFRPIMSENLKCQFNSSFSKKKKQRKEKKKDTEEIYVVKPVMS